MSKYAENTSVPVERSLAELKREINRFGATGFGYAEKGDRVQVIFECEGLRIRFDMHIPPRAAFTQDRRGNRRVDTAIDRDWEQAQRRIWRSLTAVVKAKLVAVDDGISTFEQEFLAFVVLPEGDTIGDRMVPEIRHVARTGELPPLIAGTPKVIAISEWKRRAPC